jgi:hypothetical protein
MDHFLEDNNIKITKDIELYGRIARAGARIICVSKQGDYSGFKMRVPPPEFEALLFFTALESAAKAEVLKKMVAVSKSEFDGLQEVTDSVGNRSNFFAMCQNAMAAVAFSISAIESWANKSIAIHGLVQGQPSELVFKRPNKQDRRVMSDSVASDLGIPIRPKVFQLVPQVFSTAPLKDYSTLRHRLGEIVAERNIVMHMQHKPNIVDKKVGRVTYAIKLFKTNAFMAPETILNYVSYIYGNSKIEEPSWVSIAKKELETLKKRLK